MLLQQALESIINESGLSHKETGRSFVFWCPRCSKKDKLYIRKRDGKFICWVCAKDTNFMGKAEYALTELTGIPVLDLRRRLYGLDTAPGSIFLDIRLEDWFADEEEVPNEALAASWLPVEPPPDFYAIDHPFSARGRQYLATRHIDLALARHYGLMYCPPKRRVVFPVTTDGKLIGWQARLIEEHEWWSEEREEWLQTPKILSSTSLGEKRSRCLMFADRLNGSPHAVLAEGPVDALKAHLCGGNVASMGKVVDRAQIALIRNAGISKLYLALDPDAMTETARLVRELGSEMEIYQILPPQGRKDLGEATCEEVYEEFLRAPRVTATNVFIFLTRTLPVAHLLDGADSAD